jgi:cell division protein FtsB
VKRGEESKTTNLHFVEERSRWSTFSLVLVFLVVAYLILGFGAVWEVGGSRDELQELKIHVQILRSERDSLMNILTRLESDMDFVEKVAREDFGMSRIQERIYPLPQSSGE